MKRHAFGLLLGLLTFCFFLFPVVTASSSPDSPETEKSLALGPVSIESYGHNVWMLVNNDKVGLQDEAIAQLFVQFHVQHPATEIISVIPLSEWSGNAARSSEVRNMLILTKEN